MRLSQIGIPGNAEACEHKPEPVERRRDSWDWPNVMEVREFMTKYILSSGCHVSDMGPECLSHPVWIGTRQSYIFKKNLSLSYIGIYSDTH